MNKCPVPLTLYSLKPSSLELCYCSCFILEHSEAQEALSKACSVLIKDANTASYEVISCNGCVIYTSYMPKACPTTNARLCT